MLILRRLPHKSISNSLRQDLCQHCRRCGKQLYFRGLYPESIKMEQGWRSSPLSAVGRSFETLRLSHWSLPRF